uniref:Candidate secreted effector n=1 Tax=Meloidogyne incognita TaxID=6306 RepID=A0A914MYC5_MELIC
MIVHLFVLLLLFQLLFPLIFFPFSSFALHNCGFLADRMAENKLRAQDKIPLNGESESIQSGETIFVYILYIYTFIFFCFGIAFLLFLLHLPEYFLFLAHHLSLKKEMVAFPG